LGTFELSFSKKNMQISHYFLRDLNLPHWNLEWVLSWAMIKNGAGGYAHAFTKKKTAASLVQRQRE